MDEIKTPAVRVPFSGALNGWYMRDRSSYGHYKAIDEILEEYNIKALPLTNNGYLSASIVLQHADVNFSPEGFNSLLSEYPGNCSSLILSRIQSKAHHKIFLDTVDASIEIARFLSYGLLFTSGTSPLMKKILVNGYGFEICLDGVKNPHSGNENYFLFLRTQEYKKKEKKNAND